MSYKKKQKTERAIQENKKKEDNKNEDQPNRPNPVHYYNEDEKEEENEKNFGEFEENAVLPNKIIERKNSINIEKLFKNKHHF